jgi:hypothetical protein
MFQSIVEVDPGILSFGPAIFDPNYNGTIYKPPPFRFGLEVRSLDKFDRLIIAARTLFALINSKTGNVGSSKKCPAWAPENYISRWGSYGIMFIGIT